MATPVGHSLAAYALFRSVVPRQDAESTPLLGFCVFLAMAPDLDFVPGLLLGQPALFHQGASHSLTFAVGAGLLAAVFYRYLIDSRRRFVANAALFAAAYATHLVLDPFGPDAREPYGLPLLWPISDAHVISPTPIFLGVDHVRATTAGIREWIEGVLSLHNVWAVLLELAVLLPPALIASTWRRRARRA